MIDYPRPFFEFYFKNFLLLFELEKIVFFMNIWVSDRKENINRKGERKCQKGQLYSIANSIMIPKVSLIFFLAWKLYGTFKLEFPLKKRRENLIFLHFLKNYRVNPKSPTNEMFFFFQILHKYWKFHGNRSTNKKFCKKIETFPLNQFCIFLLRVSIWQTNVESGLFTLTLTSENDRWRS